MDRSPKTDFQYDKIDPTLLMSGFSEIAMMWGRLPVCAPVASVRSMCWWRPSPAKIRPELIRPEARATSRRQDDKAAETLALLLEVKKSMDDLRKEVGQIKVQNERVATAVGELVHAAQAQRRDNVERRGELVRRAPQPLPQSAMTPQPPQAIRTHQQRRAQPHRG